MSYKNLLAFTAIVIILAFFMTACQSLPGFNIFSSGQKPEQGKPLSNFVDPRQSIQVGVGEPLALASYHRGQGMLTGLEISVNGQKLRSEATAGQADVFPENLAASQVLVWGQPAEASLAEVTFPSPGCQNLAAVGGPVQTSALPLQPPSSVWTICHIWVGQIPGSYNLGIRAVPQEGPPGDWVYQRIEVR